MIYESYYWKHPLLKFAKWLEKAIIDDENSERILARTERETFIGFYAIRKLLETFKLSTSTKKTTYRLTYYNAVDNAKPDYFNCDRIDKHFNLSVEHHENRDIGFICNQIIHSFIFVISVNETGKIEGFYLASDRMKNHKLYFIPITIVIRLFKLVGEDYPSESFLMRDPKTGQWIDANE